jgi:dipeptidyl aminopeptidase/acylaminoacyl peptidase
VLAAGYLVFAHRHALLAVPFDLKRGAVSGRPVTVENDVIMVTGWVSAQFAVSQDGTLAYMPIVPEPTRQLVWVDRTGHQEPLPVPPRVFSRPRVSPDGSRVLVIVHDTSPAAIWVYDTGRHVFAAFASLKTDLLFSPIWSPAAAWSPDGRSIAYTTEEADGWKMWRKPLDGSAAEQMLLAHSVEFAPTSWSSNGYIALDERTFRTRIDVSVVPLNEPAIHPMVNSELVEQNARFSPDGRWLAYDAGFRTANVYVRAFPGPGPTIQVSDGGGSMPVWGLYGRELFYWTGAGIATVSVSVGDGISTGVPHVVIPGAFAPEFDLSRDGRRFLLMKPLHDAPPLQLDAVTGWLDHVQRLTSSAASK